MRRPSHHGKLKYLCEPRPMQPQKQRNFNSRGYLPNHTAVILSVILTTRREKNSVQTLTSSEQHWPLWYLVGFFFFFYFLPNVFTSSFLICSAAIVILIMQHLSGLLSRQQQTYSTLIALATGQPAQINLARWVIKEDGEDGERGPEYSIQICRALSNSSCSNRDTVLWNEGDDGLNLIAEVTVITGSHFHPS